MKILLYYAPIACSLAPYITLTEAGADFEVRSINLRKGQQKSPEYLKINPKHKVPLLVVDGNTLSENVAIQQWIDMTFPSANLFPKDPWQRLQAVSLLSWCSSGIHPYLTRMNSPIAVCDVPGTEESVFKIARVSPIRELQACRRDVGWARVLLRPLHRARFALLLVLPPRNSVRHRPVAVQELHGTLRTHENSRERSEASCL